MEQGGYLATANRRQAGTDCQVFLPFPDTTIDQLTHGLHPSTTDGYSQHIVIAHRTHHIFKDFVVVLRWYVLDRLHGIRWSTVQHEDITE